MQSVLTLIYDLAEAIGLADAERTFYTLSMLADRLGTEAAVALAEALAAEARPLQLSLAGVVLPVSCA